MGFQRSSAWQPLGLQIEAWKLTVSAMAESLVPAHNPLSAKLSQVLGTSYTDYGVRLALGSLDERFTENTPTSRRNLRATFELIDIEKSGALLTQYEQVISVSPAVPIACLTPRAYRI
jgi:hypothetical protein